MARSKKSSKKIQTLIFLMLITLIMGLTATYAWFSTQRDVEISGMKLNVEVAESMQISLDGEKWTQSINIADMRQFYGTYNPNGTEGFAIYQAKNGDNLNYVPTELIPVSSAGEVSSGKLQFVQGTITNNSNGTQSLSGVTKCTETDIVAEADIEDKEENNKFHPYLVFDMYLRNISSKTTGIDELKLNEGSSVYINTATTDDSEQEGKGVAGTGLEYSARVGMIIYGNTVAVTAKDDATLGTVGQQIRNISADGNEVAAIWEPNDKEHTQYVVDNNGRGITRTTEAITTYGIKSAVATSTPNTIANINSTADTNLVAVDTFKTPYSSGTGTIGKNTITDIDGNNIGLEPNQISKVRVYIWLEGQDPDCIDLASTGDKLNVTLKLTKPSNEFEQNTYLPNVADFNVPPLENAVETQGTDNQFKYIELENGKIQLTKYLGTETNVVIPATYEGYSIYSIGNLDATSSNKYHIFGATNSKSNTTVKSITISEGIEIIDTCAFSGCTGLTGNLTLPSTIKVIGVGAFNGCKGLTGDLTIPEGVTTIEQAAFNGCSGFNGELTLPSTLTKMESFAFSQCSSLTGDIIIPEGVTTIEKCAFQACTGFNGNVTLPNGITYIGEKAFLQCTGLTGDLIIPEGVTTIEQAAFNQCSGFNGELILPSTLTHIGINAFSRCTGLIGDLKLPENLELIETTAFGYCIGFTGNLTIPEGVTFIGDAAFAECSGFNGDLTLPSTLREIGIMAFASCSKLIGDLNIPEGVTSIGKAAFQNCKGFNGLLTLPSTLVSIGDWAFNQCSNLINASITIPKSTTIIGTNQTDASFVFNNVATKTLVEYKVENGNTTFKVLNGVLFNESGTRLVAYPPSKMGNTYEIPEGVTIIDEGAFNYAGTTDSNASETGLKKIILPNSYILTTTLPASYRNSGNNLALGLFYSGTQEVIVKENNANYKTVDGVLYSKDGTILWYVPPKKTGEVIIEEGVTTIKADAFISDSNAGGIEYTSVKIPASVTLIENSGLENLGSSIVTFDENCIYEFKADGTIGTK